MTYIQKCEWLKQYQTSLRRQDVLLRRIQETRTRAERVTQALRPVAASGCPGDTVGRSVEALDAYQRELDREVLRGQALCDTIHCAICRVPDPLLRDVLELCYLDGLHRWQVANELHSCERHVRRLHKAAVDMLIVPDDCPVL